MPLGPSGICSSKLIRSCTYPRCQQLDKIPRLGRVCNRPVRCATSSACGHMAGVFRVYMKGGRASLGAATNSAAAGRGPCAAWRIASLDVCGMHAHAIESSGVHVCAWQRHGAGTHTPDGFCCTSTQETRTARSNMSIEVASAIVVVSRSTSNRVICTGAVAAATATHAQEARMHRGVVDHHPCGGAGDPLMPHIAGTPTWT